MSNLISDCCGAYEVGNSSDFGICPDCKEHCEYIEAEPDEPSDDDIFNGTGIEGGINYKPDQLKKIR